MWEIRAAVSKKLRLSRMGYQDMTKVAVEKKAEFIVEQQTQFASKIGQLEDIVARRGVPSRHVFACENISPRLRCW